MKTAIAVGKRRARFSAFSFGRGDPQPRRWGKSLSYAQKTPMIERERLTIATSIIGGVIMGNDVESLAHTKWRCQYHIVFAAKYRRRIIYGKYRAEIGKILRMICNRYGIELIEAQACPDHIHMLVYIPPKMSVSKFMGILKGKSSLMIFDQFAQLKYKYRSRHFWARGYYEDR